MPDGRWIWEHAHGEMLPGLAAVYQASLDCDKVHGTWWSGGAAGESTIAYLTHGEVLYCVAAYYLPTHGRMQPVKVVVTQMRGGEACDES